ncbi:MAG: EamA family transporter [bacterium]
MNIFIAFLNPIIHGFSNTLDSHLSNNIFSRVRVFVFFGGLLNLFSLPIIFSITKPNFLSIDVLPFILLIALIETTYLFPYYKAVKVADTSIVNALFSLGKVFVPILAFFIVKERLATVQYLGFIVIIISSVLLTFEPKNFKFNKSLLLMGIVSIILAIEGIIYKYILESISWGTGFFWVTLFSSLISVSIFAHKPSQVIIKENFKSFKKSFKILIAQEILTWSGNMVEVYAISILPITMVKGITSSQPIFVLIYAVLFAKLFPHAFKEKTDMGNMIKKIILFLIMIGGTLLVIQK